MLKRTLHADRMDTADEAPQPFQRVGVVEFGRTTAMPGEGSKTKALKLLQAASVGKLHGGNDRDFLLDQLVDESMLFEDRGVAPALRTIELRHQRRPLFHADLIDPILVAVERQQTPIAIQADAIECIEHGVRRQPGEVEYGGGIGHGCHCTSLSQIQTEYRECTKG